MSQRAFSPQTLQQARLGSLDALREIGKYITPRNLSIDIINILFDHLTTDSIPHVGASNRIHAPEAAAAARPTLSLRVIWKVISLREDIQRREVDSALRQKILECGDAVFEWTKFSLQRGFLCVHESMVSESQPTRLEQYLLQADLLLELLHFDKECFDTMTSLRAFTGLFVELWTAHSGVDSRSTPASRMVFNGRGRTCPIIELASMVLTNKPSQDDFLKQCSNAQLCDEFCQAIVDRIDYGFNGLLASPGSADSFEALLGVATCLVCTNDLFFRRLTRLQYLTKFCARIFQAVEASTADGVPMYLPRSLNVILKLAAYGTSTTQLCKNWSQLYDAQFLQVLFRVTAALTPRDREAQEMVLNVVAKVCDAICYPKLGSSTLGGSRPSSSALKGNKTALIAWNRLFHLQDRAKVVRDRLSGRPKVFMCDYQKCKNSGIAFTQMAKECSGCSSAVYCSEKCQGHDWEELHRNECNQARNWRSARIESQIFHYDHEARASHVALLEVIYAGLGVQGHPGQDRITAVDCGSVRDRIGDKVTIEDLSKVQTNWSSLPQTYLNARLNALVSSYGAGSFPPGYHLVEGIFPPFTAAHKVIRLMTVLKPVEGGYVGVYCVARAH